LQIGLAFLIIKFVFFPVLGLVFGSELPVVAVLSGSMEHDDRAGVVCGVRAPDDYRGSLSEYWALCGAWYEARGITQAQFESFPLKNGFNKGDIIVLVGPQRRDLVVGDIIVYESREQYPIIHRVVAVTAEGGAVTYETKGDYNPAQIEQYVLADQYGRYSSCEAQGAPAPCSVGTPVTRATPGAVAILDETAISQDAVIGRAVLRIPLLGWVKIGATNAVNWIVQ
jgi:hypothetical protein